MFEAFQEALDTYRLRSAITLCEKPVSLRYGSSEQERDVIRKRYKKALSAHQDNPVYQRKLVTEMLNRFSEALGNGKPYDRGWFFQELVIDLLRGSRDLPDMQKEVLGKFTGKNSYYNQEFYQALLKENIDFEDKKKIAWTGLFIVTNYDAFHTGPQPMIDAIRETPGLEELTAIRLTESLKAPHSHEREKIYDVGAVNVLLAMAKGDPAREMEVIKVAVDVMQNKKTDKLGILHAIRKFIGEDPYKAAVYQEFAISANDQRPDMASFQDDRDRSYEGETNGCLVIAQGPAAGIPMVHTQVWDIPAMPLDAFVNWSKGGAETFHAPMRRAKGAFAEAAAKEMAKAPSFFKEVAQKLEIRAHRWGAAA